MRRTVLAVALLAFVFSGSVSAKEKKEDEKFASPYTFTEVIDNYATPVKNQYRSGTCWCYSALSQVESDVVKRKGDNYRDIDLSEMWIVRNTYFDKVMKYVRMHGETNLSQGGAAHDVINMIDAYGIVPEEAYPGLNYGTELPVFGELDLVLINFAKSIVENPNKTLTTAWVPALNAILDSYFGKAPEKFTYKGKEYTPKSFAQELGINGSDYVAVTSFTHHPFGEKFILEVPDNWMWGSFLNLPLEDMVAIADEAVKNGYTITWASDVSEKGFEHGRGFAVLAATKAEEMDNNERDKWEKKSTQELADSYGKFKEVIPERNVTQESRQKEFDNYQTTDDHGMHITGIYKDQRGEQFYKVKNSWSTDNSKYDGYFFCSMPFFKAKTLNILVHKDALSQATKAKYGIE